MREVLARGTHLPLTPLPIASPPTEAGGHVNALALFQRFDCHCAHIGLAVSALRHWGKGDNLHMRERKQKREDRCRSPCLLLAVP
jgi:hypothetical protein